jgi:hypothetical protein
VTTRHAWTGPRLETAAPENYLAMVVVEKLDEN